MAKKYTKGKDGYYRTNVWDGTYTGRHKNYVMIRSKKSSKDLELKVEEYKRSVEERRNVHKNDLTFLAYAKEWRKTYKGQKEINTKAMYDNVIDRHFNALPDTLRLQDVDRVHLQTLLNNANKKPRTQQMIYMTFRQILFSAVSDHLFPANVADDIFRTIERPKYRPEEKRPLTPKEKSALFKADLDLQDKAFVYILYGCGLRRGEALALTIFDIKDKQISVTKSHAFSTGIPVQKPPKSLNGYRTIPIPKSVSKAILAHVNAVRESGQTYLFTMHNGEPMTLSSYEKMWRRIIKAMQAESKEPITGLTAHVFRHNYCTNLCYQIPKISIKHIAALLGDTNKMVLDVYNHVMMEKEDSKGAINAAL